MGVRGLGGLRGHHGSAREHGVGPVLEMRVRRRRSGRHRCAPERGERVEDAVQDELPAADHEREHRQGEPAAGERGGHGEDDRTQREDRERLRERPAAQRVGDEGEAERGTCDEALAADRHPLAARLSIEVLPGNFTQWARGAAVIAIQTYVLGAG